MPATSLSQLKTKNNMSDIKVSKNITVTIKGQTFVLNSEEAKDLFNKLKNAGVDDPWPWLPPYNPHTPYAPNTTPYPIFPDVIYSVTTDDKTSIK